MSRVVLAAAILSYVLVYELVFFNVGPAAAGSLIWFFKLVFPFGLLLLAISPPASGRLASRSAVIFLSLYAAFILWAFVPSLWIGGMDSLVSWTRYAIRLVFAVALIFALARERKIFILFGKFAVAWGVTCVFQYALLVGLHQYSRVGMLYEGSIALAGPHGLLGNVSAFVEKDGAFPLVRLTGFWLEPSNASAYLFACFFLARFLVATEGKRIWRAASYLCILGGGVTFSSAGYCAIGAALSYGAAAKFRGMKRGRLKSLILIMVGIAVLGFGLVGRWILINKLPQNEVADSIAGVKAADTIFSSRSDWDFTEGRLDLLLDTIKNVPEHPIGIGVRLTSGDTGVEASASAPIYWLKFTGVIGLLVLLAREGVVLRDMAHVAWGNQTRVLLAQAWVVVFVQNLSYGTWMSPFYLTLTAGVLIWLEPGVSQRGFSQNHSNLTGRNTLTNRTV